MKYIGGLFVDFLILLIIAQISGVRDKTRKQIESYLTEMVHNDCSRVIRCKTKKTEKRKMNKGHQTTGALF